MRKTSNRLLSTCLGLGITWICLLHLAANTAFAAPYFYIFGNTDLSTGEVESFQLRLNTDGNQVGAVQVAVSFSSSYFNTSSIVTLSSVCSLWAPANTVPPGQNFTKVTPYFYNNKAIISCGFSGSGYNGSDGLLAIIKLTPNTAGSTSLSLGNAQMYFLGSSITVGAMSNHNVTITGAPTPTSSPTPNPSVTPTATPTATATATATASATITPTPIVNSTTLFEDVTFEDVTPSGSSGTTTTTTTTSGTSALEVVEEDDTIPVVVLTPRPDATPYVLPDIQFQEQENLPEDGEVLSVQGLRDLLVPGKSKADRTVVMINFLSTLVFLALLAVIIWKMVMSSRASSLKQQHIQELISGELATLETKMNILKEKSGSEKFQGEFSKMVDNILSDITPQEKKES